MTDLAALPDSWDIWAEGEDGRLVLAYRPDIFNGNDLPAPCLPTLYLTHGKRTRRPGQNPTDTTGRNDWYVTLYLEPEITLDGGTQFSTRSDALSAALELAQQFDAGEIDYRGCYQVPREQYFARLDEFTGREPAGKSGGE
ncbi:DUF5820 family protein [Natrialba taiwanensis]|uniref:Uncharacterized protein n=1 Tax=Natrialba taiwanensis DSM 12281 TaxID=1230458 RepID=L9ZGY0_9EURY|nr:DUF5820 family protein [Natrialba taiwanensis]ELY85745.1 hypothetical protein C484_20572 [Natrialba taiwanensis DSM 12281]